MNLSIGSHQLYAWLIKVHGGNKYILLHDWEGNTREYSVRGWQYWPERSEGQYRSRELNIPPYCPTQRSAVIDLLYDLHTVLLVVHAQGYSL